LLHNVAGSAMGDAAPEAPIEGKLLVCVGAERGSARLIRAAERMATASRSDWTAVHVELSTVGLPEDAQEDLSSALRLAEQLGGNAVVLSGRSPAVEILRYAREGNFGRIVVGAPRSRLLRLFRLTVLDALLTECDTIDVCVVACGSESASRAPMRWASRAPRWLGFIAAALAVAVATMFADLIFGRSQLSDVVMVYLLVIVMVSMRLGYGPSILAAVLSVAALDFTFVPPYLSFAVADRRRVVTFAVMFAVALVISSLTQLVRNQGSAARQRERRTALLYAMSRELAGTLGIDTMLVIASRHLHDAFDAGVVVFLPRSSDRLEVAIRSEGTFDAKEHAIADWVWGHERSAGLGTESFPSATTFFLLLRGSRDKVGILGVRPGHERRFADPEQRLLLDALAAQIGSALERGQLAEAAQRAQVEIETERLRSSLLSSISHDLRTPLGVITGATSTLLQDEEVLIPEARLELLESAHEEAERLNRLVGNLLDMTRVASGMLSPKKEWHPLDEVIGVALNRLESRLADRDIQVTLPPLLPPVPLDAILVEQVLINLLENALKYTPFGTPIEISAIAKGDTVEIAISDRGPGVPAVYADKIFEKFYRLKPDISDGGTGLGLAICRGVVEAHGGRIWVQTRIGGGASFRFRLPIGESPPLVGEPWPRAS